MTDAYIKVTDVTLEGVGGEELFQQHLAAIGQALLEQEEGDRVPGDVTFTLKVTVGHREEGLRYLATGALKLPARTGKAAVGHMTHAGKGEAPRLRVAAANAKQLVIPGTMPFADYPADHTGDTGAG